MIRDLLMMEIALAGCFSAGTLRADGGALIFQEKCASCHGADGQGTHDAYDKPLAGDHSVAILTRLIERTMPEDNPGSCVGEDARQVADYIYREFYSFEARRRKNLVPAPRVELVRLTVAQYRNAVADLLGQFTPPPGDDSRKSEFGDEPAEIKPGLRGEYFQSKGMNKADERRFERVDGRVDFDFGEGSPAEEIAADQFAIVWQGALVTQDTGYYEFRIRTQNGARLYLNRDASQRLRKLRDDSPVAGQAALIDAWVSSGEMREPEARVFLLGGRHYPLRLEFFKYKESLASIQMQWKPPHGAWSVLDDSNLTTAPAARTFVVDVPFPADDRSLGYERGTSISKEWHAAASSAAIATAAEVVDRLPVLLGTNDDNSDRERLLRDFIARLTSVAFRRPLTSDEVEVLGEHVLTGAPNLEAGVRRAVLLVLLSPSFLYTDLTPAGQAPSQHAIASRLSFALWDSIPDETLRTAADNGELATNDQVTAQARRMITNPRARAKMRDFFRQWLELDERDLAKDKAMFPEFDEVVVSDLRRSLELFIDQLFWSESSDYRQLLLADYILLNQRLRDLYGCNADASDTADCGAEDPADVQQPHEGKFAAFSFSADQRAGVLTHPYLLSALAYHNSTSPIHRGVFLTRKIVGRALKPPPVAVAFKNEEFASDLTMRQKVAQLTRDEACMACHSVINPLGYALENYDSIGRWRTDDNGQPVESKSEYVTVEGDKLEVQSARDVANYAVTSESAHRAFVVQMFHHLVKQDPYAYGPHTIDTMTSDFAADGYNMQNLMMRIAVLSARLGCSDAVPSDPAPINTPEENSTTVSAD
jgi:hypothetical protein